MSAREEMEGVSVSDVAEMQTAAKAEYERLASRRKSGLGFMDNLERFAAGETIKAMARAAGVSSTAMRKTCEKYFAPHTKLSGRARQQKRTAAKIAERARKAFARGPLGTIVREAKAAGASVEAVEAQYEVLKHSLLVNGHLCNLHCPSARYVPKRYPDRSFVMVRIARHALDRFFAFIIRVNVPGHPKFTLIIPATVMRIAFEATKSDYTKLYIPLGQDIARSRIDYQQFVGAWHLLA